MLKRARRHRRNRKTGPAVRERLLKTVKRAGRITAGLTVMCLVLGGMWTVYGELLETPYLEIKKVKIEGLRFVSKEGLVERILKGEEKNILVFDTERARRLIEEEPFIRSASVRRILPDTLEVRVEERVPVAMVLLDGLYLVDERGEIFKKYSVKDALSLPVITGLEGLDEEGLKAGIEGAMRLLKMVEGLKWPTPDRLSEIHVDRVEGFSLVTLDEGIRIELGRDHFEEKLTRLARFMHARGGDIRGISYINLNDYRGVVVGFTTPEVNEEGGMG